MSAPLPRVCIIGAGSSGIAAVKAMQDRGIPFECFEKSDQVGGLWCFRNSNGRSAAYESLHINTDCKSMGYADYPMPADTPDYPGHRLIKAYFNAYVDHFGLRRHITFNTEVIQARRQEDGLWAVTLGSGETRRCDVLIVANGHHWDPRWPPPYPGRFNGFQLHSHSYVNPREPIDFHGKHILVVGMGNSAMDIACELSRPGIAAKLYLSTRQGVWILPKYLLFGAPLTRLTNLPPWLVGWRTLSWLTRFAVWVNAGNPWQYGLPRPDHRPLAAHPTISSDIFIRLGSGDILPRPGIAELRGDTVRFTDGRCDPVDVIIWCTGYKVSFPFFDPEFIAAPDNDLPLWRRLLKPGIDNLFFVGLLQPLGATMPLAEAQAKLIGDHLLGRCAFPDPAAMQADIRQERAALFRRYQKTARHTMQVDFQDYLRQLRKIARQGARHARAQSYRPPIPARAAGRRQ